MHCNHLFMVFKCKIVSSSIHFRIWTIVLLTWAHKTLDDFGGKLGLLFHSEVTVSSKPNVWTERWPLTWCFGGASSSLRGIVFWQVRYDRCWHSWHKLNFSAEQIRPSGTLSLPLVYVADIFRPHFTQPKKPPTQLMYFFTVATTCM